MLYFLHTETVIEFGEIRLPGIDLREQSSQSRGHTMNWEQLFQMPPEVLHDSMTVDDQPATDTTGCKVPNRFGSLLRIRNDCWQE